MNKYMKVPDHLKKNCENCKHLEWAFGDVGDSEGFICNKKELYDLEESRMLENMSEDKYRAKSKICFVPQDLYFVGYREVFERPDRKGYTTDIKLAGRYTLSQALSMTGKENKYILADSDNGYYPRWFAPCSALDSMKDGKLHPKEMY